MSPALANSRKQMRQRSNFLMYPRFRPQRQHLFTFREENFGVFCDLITCAFVAIFF